ncbi:DUF4232 domain-containing protein [Streptomyces sp. NPDC057411]|uniref:DUF4232 domain-containing protein n=1 Tax=unclassified Streptomyces TaxID=2593676 RepID=UPI0036408B91
MRTQRKNTVLAVTAAAVLSLGLSACGGGDAGTRDEGAAPAQGQHQAAAGAAATTGGSAGGSTTGGSTGGTATKGSTTGGTTGSGSGSGTGASKGSAQSASTGTSAAGARSCAYGDVRITAAKADETPTEHITLTATNTSGSTCRLDGYPLIAFGAIQTAKDVPAVAKSKPAAPVVLRPGAPAYANVRIALGGAHEDNKVVTSFNVNLFAGSDPAEGSVVVKAPAGGLAVDEAAAKTGYWTYELRNGADEF